MKYTVSSIKYKFFLFCILYTVYSILYTAPASASELSLGISPPLLQIEAIPPASVTAPITVQNLSDESVELQIVFKPFTQGSNEDGTPQYYTKDQPFPGANPHIFEKMQILDAGAHAIQSLLLAPHQEKNLTLHIGILKDEPLSDYYFSIVFISKTPEGSDANATQASGGVATNVLLSIGTKGQAKGFLEEFSAPFFVEKGPVPFTVRLKNTSAHYINPEGEILIKNMFGQIVGRVDLLPVAILAHTIRAIPDSLQSPDSTGSAKMNYERLIMNSPKAFWNESFLLGPYSATLTVALSPEGPRYIKTIHFIAFPNQAVVALVASLIFILIIRDRLNRRLE